MELARGRQSGGQTRRVLPLRGRHDLNPLVDGARAVSVFVLADACSHRSAATERNVYRIGCRVPLCHCDGKKVVFRMHWLLH